MALAAKNALGPMPPGGLHHWREATQRHKPPRVLCAPHREVIPLPVYVNRRVDVFDDKVQWIHALREAGSLERSQ